MLHVLRLPRNLTVTCSKCCAFCGMGSCKRCACREGKLLSTPVESTLHYMTTATSTQNVGAWPLKACTQLGSFACTQITGDPTRNTPKTYLHNIFEESNLRNAAKLWLARKAHGNVTNGLHFFDHPARRLKLRVAGRSCPGLPRASAKEEV